MIPGSTTKLTEETIASTTTISPKTDLVKLTGNTTIATIIPSFGGGFSGIVCLVPTDAAISTTTSGNIAAAVAMTQNQVNVLVYSRKTGKWYPSAVS